MVARKLSLFRAQWVPSDDYGFENNATINLQIWRQRANARDNRLCSVVGVGFGGVVPGIRRGAVCSAAAHEASCKRCGCQAVQCGARRFESE